MATIIVAILGLQVVAIPQAGHAQQGAAPPAVLVQSAELKPLSEQTEFIGRAVAVDKVNLVARVKGVLGPRLFKDGDDVKEGQLLFTIERDPYQAAVDQKIAQRDSAKATLVNAELQLKRAEELLRTKTGTQATYDQRLSEQLQAKAAVENAEAQLRDAEIQLSYTEIKSPITGRVGRAAFSPGNIVGPDSGILATVVSEHPMRVLFPVTQRELLEARRGGGTSSDPKIVVQLRLADGSLYKEKGKLDFLDVTADPKTDTQIVRAVFDNTDNSLTDGQTVRVILEGEQVPSVIVIPQAAIAVDQAGPYVYVINDKNVAELRRIKTGFSREGLVSVTDGLNAGEKVIVQGQQRVRPGMTVKPALATAGQK
ncbi:membrane fusion protein, multidrug efflux system [Enhydrobacter aerosaccus]|uniref:Membrane fusion protein, multidrug efflux system n=1 Tax=Enhydrobacter aerosaccus TaxID=225324 RepID=A0A1T4RAL4_9HYPH|nr:efflux RND transporter periplasmic adaptor subunit [Enhydrobacter aerosaccus]SKA12985.1 membrane fusion protein, multidrug efflux system [Enhydrobacter aerosaccus]